MAIEKKFPNAPTDVAFNVLSLLQKWSLMLKEEDRSRILQVKDDILVKHFRPNGAQFSFQKKIPPTIKEHI